MRENEEQTATNVLSRLETPSSRPRVTPLGQMVFCIDVRSEPYRAELEKNGDIETFGFAGFFGLPLLVKGERGVRPHFPPLLQATLELEAPGKEKNGAVGQGLAHALASPVSSLVYVEAWGLTYLARLLADSTPESSLEPPSVSPIAKTNTEVDSRIDLAAAILKGTGLTFPLAPVVAFVGHDSRCTNNLHQASLACGACAGHSGVPNAQVAASMLNDIEVRKGLREKGYEIGDDVLFVAAEHETVTDTVTLIVPSELSRRKALEVARIQLHLREATATRQRARHPSDDRQNAPKELGRRTRDFAETQAELGLAGNAAFLIGRRELSRGVPLGGRAFLHSYDSEADPDDSTLEMILSGPAVVTSWINLQYYASTVAPRTFGSGRKTLHNLVGEFGVIEGGEGDLAIGLSRESLTTREGEAHAPLRLHLMVETSVERLVQSIRRVETIRALAAGGWIHVTAIDSRGARVEHRRVSPELFLLARDNIVAAE